MPTLQYLMQECGSLVLARNPDQAVVIGDPANPIAVVVLIETVGATARLAIKAPRSVPINRLEIAEQILAEREKS